ncbi:MAG: Gfo/Idh/MocA family oxidoreductase [Paracoccus sp. (in: a-proteobacteria)]|uniref:Gfo/Idh/MocA family protein n=1 Tax=Paracoccus sp. TaxID=267 RepID=UPI0026E07FDD|nr:Gfo/Idh/MocA family oxidoreductase [Paracoccus sp. (in: a-proteobacteria)]MDO5611920.1 Gfo/Idh/MocA family oxidoreductase [Paracoccus sp. (in: a-proteobacteria)]
MSLAVGVIGAGVMGGFHARLFAEEISGARLVAVSDPDPARATAAAYGAQLFDDGLALIESDAVEAVVVAAPDAAHHELVMAAIGLGKPVLCEKPLASTVAQCREIADADAGRNLVSLGFMRRFDPSYREMKRELNEGRIGAPLLMHCVHRNRAAPHWFDGPMIVTNAMVHEIDICRWLLDAEYTSASLTQIGDANDMLLAELRTDRGAVISVEMFMNAAYGYHVHAEIVGREGVVAMAEPAQVRLRRNGAMRAGYSPDWIGRFADSYRLQDQAWVRASRYGLPCEDMATARDGLLATDYCQQLVEHLPAGGGLLAPLL